jgi:ribonuclease J
MVRLAPAPAALIDDVPTGRLYRDGAIITRAEDGQVRERRKLSFAGSVSVSLVLSDKGALLADPEVALSGIPTTDTQGTSFETIAREAAIGTIESIPRPRRKDQALVSEAVRRSVRAAVNQAWGKKPVCSVLLTVL